MPIYEYCCENGHTFEVRQEMGDKPVEKCTICEGRVKRAPSLFSQKKNAGIHLFDRRTGGIDLLHDR